jgi:hypothetical protein
MSSDIPEMCLLLLRLMQNTDGLQQVEKYLNQSINQMM